MYSIATGTIAASTTINFGLTNIPLNTKGSTFYNSHL
jgi:hypothetical protein